MSVVLILMVKNEANIIKRCLDSAHEFVDAFFILDTGSNDDTCNIILDLISCNIYNKPMKLSNTEFKTFGKTRSESFNLAKEFVANECKWDISTSYGLLLDADMVFRIGNFNKSTISLCDQYKILQRQSHLEYHNTRLIRMSLNWICIGSTHEYWKCTEKNIKIGVFTTTEKMWIDDISDGGCKSDKLNRDEKLLTDDLEDAIKNCDMHAKQRTLYYLAETYKHMKLYERSIAFHLQRIDAGGWEDEIWASYYNIAAIYELLDNTEKTIEYCKIAYKYDNTRSEPLYILAKTYIINGDYEKAIEYVNIGIKIKRNDKKTLIIDLPIYAYGFYELKFTILTKIPSTVSDLLHAGINLFFKSPPSYIRGLFESIIHDLSSVLDVSKMELIENETYDKTILATKIGKSIIIHKSENSVYTPIFLEDDTYTCIGLINGGIVFYHSTKCLTYKYKILLELFVLDK